MVVRNRLPITRRSYIMDYSVRKLSILSCHRANNGLGRIVPDRLKIEEWKAGD